MKKSGKGTKRKFKKHRLVKWEFDKQTTQYVHYIRTSWFWGVIWWTRKNRFTLKPGVDEAKFILGWDRLINEKLAI